MSEAPERIWAFYTPDDFDDTATITAYEMVQHGGKEYCRADLPPTLSAAMELPEIQALVDAATALLVQVDGLIPIKHPQQKLERNKLRHAITALAAIKEPKT